MPLTITNARLLTMAGPDAPRRGGALRDLGIIEHGSIQIGDDGRITDVVPGGIDAPCERIDAHGRVVLPGFVDCHTHACWAGQRFDEWERKLAGATYLELLKAGGGIMATVRAVRAASQDDLANNLHQRVRRMLALGTTTIEVKSGYGLNTDAELKMLRAIEQVGRESPVTLHSTFLGAHAIDPDAPDFVHGVIHNTLPAVAHEFPGITCDAYCEDGAWSLDETRNLFEAARSLGCPLRVHADQFHSLGMTRLAVDMGAVSVDHLEATTPEELRYLAQSDTSGVMLPCSGFQVDDRYAPGRSFLDAGGALAIATNYNPGSAPTPSMPFAIALACRKLGLTPAEAITCATINPAALLGQANQIGSLEPGKRADLQMLDVTDERELAYEFATPGPCLVMCGGVIVHRDERWCD